MKALNNLPIARKISSFLFFLLVSVSVFAQDATKDVDVDISTDSGPAWYGQPWVWAIGVAIFIVIIVAITRSNRNNA